MGVENLGVPPGHAWSGLSLALTGIKSLFSVFLELWSVVFFFFSRQYFCSRVALDIL